jgi:hypothetical protein
MFCDSGVSVVGIVTKRSEREPSKSVCTDTGLLQEELHYSILSRTAYIA